MSEAEEHEIARLLQKINVKELEFKARTIRGNGIPCKLHLPTSLKDLAMGGMNVHLEIHFDDGLIWLARIRRTNATSPPPSHRDYSIHSEVATLLYLEKINIPSPKMLGYAIEGEDNPVGIAYILMPKLPGTVLKFSNLPVEGKKNILDQIADMYVKLSQHPFEEMGCLDQPGTSQIGSFTRECLTDFSSSGTHRIDPFTHIQDFYIANIRLLMELIHRKEIYTENPVDAYLVHLFLLEKIPEIYPKSNPNPTGEREEKREREREEKFYLKHADDKGTHILTDLSLNITAFLDWEWCSTAPFSVSSSSPLMLFPVLDFFDVVTTIGEDEEMFAKVLEGKGEKKLASAVRMGRLHCQVMFCCNFDCLIPFEDLGKIFGGIRENLREDYHYSWEAWKEIALERYRQDSRLVEILATV